MQAVQEGTGARERLQAEEREEMAEGGTTASKSAREEMFLQPWEMEGSKPQEEGREKEEGKREAVRVAERPDQQASSEEMGGRKREVERR